MTITVINSNVVGPDNSVYLGAGDLFIVNQGASFASWSTGFAAGVYASPGVYGVGVTVLGSYAAPDLVLNGGDRLAVGKLGAVTMLGSGGVVIAADLANGLSTLVNEGSIHSSFASGSDALSVSLSDVMAFGAAALVLTNTGLIEATSAALFLTGTGRMSLVNSGTISGAISSAGPTLDLRNSGLISGGIQLDAGADRIVNAGTIAGDIDTGGGNDLLDLRGGRILGGSLVDGGAGDDTYYLDRASVNIVDASGQDTIFAGVDYTLASGIEVLSLTDGAIRGTGNAENNRITGNAADNRLFGDAGNDTLSGSRGDDVLTGEAGLDSLDGGAGNDRLYGGALTDQLYGGDGEDLLVGGAGRDSLWGGADGDVFAFARLNHTTAAAYDFIMDFTAGEDVIDLSGLDANAGNALANDAFTWLGTGAFTNVAGQLRYEVVGAVTWVRMDVTGDGVADGLIRLNGALALSAGDFVL